MCEVNDPRNRLEQYLLRVRGGLQGIPHEQVGEIVQELRSHIQDRAEVAGVMTDSAVQAATDSLGKPEDLARMYRAENLTARAIATRSPWLIFRSVIRWAFLSVGGFVVFIVALAGYLMAAGFFLCAVLKPFFPRNVGMWLGGNLSVFDIGAHWPAPTGTREVLGLWMIPISLVAGTVFFLLTHRFTLASVRSFRRTRVTYA